MIIFWTLIAVITLAVISILFLSHRVTQSKKMVFFLAITIPAVSLAMYFQWGKSQLLSEYLVAQENTVKVQKEMQALGSLDNIITKMEEQVHIHQDAKGWFLLGRLYMRAERFDQAVDALKQANQLQPDQVETLMAYAEALYFANHQQLNNQVRLMLQQVLQLDANQPDALNLSALDAYQRGDYQEATQVWRKLLAQLPEDHEQAKAILATIEGMQK